jgi:aromatic-L-amino-acid decarboxylase
VGDRINPDPHPSSFRDDGAAALEWVASYLERLRELPVLARADPGEIRAALPPSPPEHGEPFSDVLRDVEEILLPGVTHWQSPRFFGYFAVTGSEPGILGELLTAALNNVGFVWRTSPALTELERHVLDWLAQLLGLPSGLHGHIEDTASVSMVAALAAARDARPDRRAVLFSEHANVAVEKAARTVGLEPRPVPVDGEYRMRADGLELSDACAVVATVGTTSTASVDPVPALADLCARDGVWLHVDAAYAGAAWVCPELRASAEGVDRADSIVVNAHKWLLTPMDCSCLWTRRPEDFRRTFSVGGAPYLPGDPAESLSDYGPALGRRFRALKLWIVLRHFGREGLQRVIREHVRLAALFEEWVRREPGWEVVAPRHFSLVCFRRDGSDGENERLLERVNASGEVFLSQTRLDGSYVLRLAIGNLRTTEADVRLAWEVLRREAARL